MWFTNIHQNQCSSTEFKRGERGGAKESARLQEKRQEPGGRWNQCSGTKVMGQTGDEEFNQVLFPVMLTGKISY